ncbi:MULTISPECIES: hypothetical protein [unclassified Endozoicomonas]|uniref:hypothetical protein n=1 Tax=unclassified Endozoicomonas TaxID=2644528 RepID=UPI002147931A|nr:MULTISPECIES: hypothetical protein [unclassified Endozoicomonas]
MIKHSSIAALMLLISILSVAFQAEALTERFIVEIQKNELFPKQSFSIKPGLRILSAPPGIANPNGCTDSDSPPYDKRHQVNSYGIKTRLIESISWQLLYASHLLVGYKLTLNTNVKPLKSNLYSWLPLAAAITVLWLFKNSHNLDLPLFNPTEQKEITSMLGEGFAITMVAGSEHNQQSHQPPESPGQQAPEVTHAPRGYFTNLLYSVYGGGDGEPHSLLHTLGFNCFIFPCFGVCSFRPASDSRGASKGTMISVASPTANPTHSMSAEAAGTTHPAGSLNECVTEHRKLTVSANDSIIVHGLLSLSHHNLPEENGTSSSHSHSKRPIETSASGCLPSGGAIHCQQALSNYKRGDRDSQRTCVETMAGKDGQERQCGKVYKNTRALANHKRTYHTGQKTCDLTVVGKDGQPRPCRKVYKNAGTLSYHKKRDHTGQQTCDVTLVREDDSQLWPCGKICKNAQSLSYHKIRDHTAQQTCEITVVGKDGQPRPCGKVCKNAHALTDHRRIHRKRKPF